MTGAIDHELKLTAIRKDKIDLLNYVLQNGCPIEPHDLLVCMDINAVKCFEILYCHMAQRCTEMMNLHNTLRTHWNYEKGGFFQSLFRLNDSLLRQVSKLLDRTTLRTKLHDCTWRRLDDFKVKQRLLYLNMVATLLETVEITTDSDEAIPQHLSLRRLRLKNQFGETYIEPFSRESIDEIDPHLVWPSEDGFRFYHLAFMVDYINQKASECYKDDLEVTINDPITRRPLTPLYVNKTYTEASRLISLYRMID